MSWKAISENPARSRICLSVEGDIGESCPLQDLSERPRRIEALGVELVGYDTLIDVGDHLS